MKIAVLATVAASVLLLGVAPPPPPPQTRRCDVDLNVSDPDPAGLNVRADASAASAVLTALKPQGEWIQVHVTGQQADWYRIDRAAAVTDEEESGERVLFEGTGWVHRSKVGDVDLNAGAKIFGDLDKPPIRVLPLDGETPPFKIIGCVDENLLIEMDGRAGFTRDYCANQRTTCS